MIEISVYCDIPLCKGVGATETKGVTRYAGIRFERTKRLDDGLSSSLGCPSLPFGYRAVSESGYAAVLLTVYRYLRVGRTIALYEPSAWGGMTVESFVSKITVSGRGPGMLPIREPEGFLKDTLYIFTDPEGTSCYRDTMLLDRMGGDFCDGPAFVPKRPMTVGDFIDAAGNLLAYVFVLGQDDIPPADGNEDVVPIDAVVPKGCCWGPGGRHIPGYDLRLGQSAVSDMPVTKYYLRSLSDMRSESRSIEGKVLSMYCCPDVGGPAYAFVLVKGSRKDLSTELSDFLDGTIRKPDDSWRSEDLLRRTEMNAEEQADPMPPVDAEPPWLKMV